MAKLVGSELFGTTVIRADEYVLLAQVMKENGSTPEQIVLDIEAIDDLLQLQRVRTLLVPLQFTRTGRLRKDYTFSSIVERRIEKLVEDLER